MNTILYVIPMVICMAGVYISAEATLDAAKDPIFDPIWTSITSFCVGLSLFGVLISGATVFGFSLN